MSTFATILSCICMRFLFLASWVLSSPFPPTVLIGAAAISAGLPGVTRISAERGAVSAAAARSITPVTSFTDLFSLEQQRPLSSSISSYLSDTANDATTSGATSKLLKRPHGESRSSNHKLLDLENVFTEQQQPVRPLSDDRLASTSLSTKKTRVAPSSGGSVADEKEQNDIALQSIHADSAILNDSPSPSQQAQMNLFSYLQKQIQAFLQGTGELVQKQASASASVFVGEQLRKGSVKAATTLIETQYVSGVGFLAAQTARSLITDNGVVSSLLADSISKEATKIIESAKSNIGDKLNAELTQSGSTLRGLKLVAEGFGKDVLTKGTYDHFEQLCRLRRHSNPQLKKFGQDVTQLVIFSNPTVNPLVALTIIQFVCLTKTFPTSQVTQAFPSVQKPLFVESSSGGGNSMSGIAESAKRIIADNKADRILADKLAFLPNQVKPPLKKWMSDAHVSVFNGLCTGLKSENEHVRTLSMMVRNQIAGQSAAEAFTFKAFIDTICFGASSGR